MIAAAKAAIIGTAAGALAIGLGYALLPDQGTGPLLQWSDAAVVTRGHGIYDRDCVNCHGPLTKPRSTSGLVTSHYMAPPHDASGHTWKHPDYALFKLTKSGEAEGICKATKGGGMPRFGQTLSDRQIVDVLSYIKSTWPADIRASQDETNTLYAAQNAAVRALIDASRP